MKSPLLIALGIIHLAVGIAFSPKTATAIFADGFVNAVETTSGRAAWFWFMLTGIVILVLGHLALFVERRLGALPRFLGWELLAVGVITTAAIPVSGGWLVIALSVAILVDRRSLTRRSGHLSGQRHDART